MKLVPVMYVVAGALAIGFSFVRFWGVDSTRALLLIAAGLYLVFRGVMMMRRRS
jgi:hypothetical protein